MSLEKAFTELVFKGFKGEALTEFVEILKEADEELLWLQCLESAGVDNWSGCDYAADLLREEKGE